MWWDSYENFRSSTMLGKVTRIQDWMTAMSMMAQGMWQAMDSLCVNAGGEHWQQGARSYHSR
ncbi:hypothetical protein BXT84_12635 [Sulfobacillus thermotolerans]|uniref:Uncharacterized protein n=1 Tax=Sulfobacillus thermotolerans TaxID=338644 RepID=A0ABM6RTD3_9FIRM|nr:hypothetical protein BXT84_12635 [Sulfobacillus thermotolerans]